MCPSRDPVSTRCNIFPDRQFSREKQGDRLHVPPRIPLPGARGVRPDIYLKHLRPCPAQQDPFLYLFPTFTLAVYPRQDSSVYNSAHRQSTEASAYRRGSAKGGRILFTHGVSSPQDYAGPDQPGSCTRKLDPDVRGRVNVSKRRGTRITSYGKW